MAAMRMRYVDVTRRKGRPSAHATTPLPGVLARALRRAGRALAGATAEARRGDPDGVHDARVACRRLREALAIAASAQVETGRLDRRLRRIARAMGPVRELDVARGELDALAAAESWPPPIVSLIEASCSRRRDRARASMLTKLDRADEDAVLRAVGEVRDSVAAEQDGRAWTQALAQRVRARAGDLVRAIDRAGTLYVPDALHEIRLASKKLRYALELAPSAAEWRPGVARGRLRRAQKSLGTLGDLQLVQREVQRLAARAGGARTRRQALTSIDRDLERRCRAAHADVLRSLPGLRVLASRLARVNALEAFPLRAARMVPADSADAGATSGHS